MAIKVAGQTVVDDNRRITGVTDDLPSIRPTLNLDFANAKVLDPRIDFTRSSTATYWDGKTTAKAEENLLKYSDDFLNGSWIIGEYTTRTANQGTAPDGETTADLFTINRPTVDGNSYIVQKVPVTSGVTYTGSVYLKAYSAGDVGKHIDIWQFFNSGVISVTPVTLTDSWQRVSLTNLCTDTQSSMEVISFGLIPSAYGGSSDLSVSFLAWGAQAEARDSVTAYTPTSGTPITRYQPVLQTASANQPRFDHDPVTGESKGLLIEEARTNLNPYSEQYSAWSFSPYITQVGTTIAPSGANNAVALMGNGSQANIYVHTPLLEQTTGSTYTVSVWAKRLSGTPSTAGNIISAQYFIDGSGNLGRVNLSITNVTDSWQRYSVTFTTQYSGSVVHFFAADTNSASEVIAIWGLQVEQGAFPTSYIPTSGSQVTRAVDVATMSTDGWYNPEESTVYVEGHILAPKGTQYYPRLFAVVNSDSPDTNNWGLAVTTDYDSGNGDFIASTDYFSGSSYGGSALSASWVVDPYSSFKAVAAIDDTGGSFAEGGNYSTVSATIPTGLGGFDQLRILGRAMYQDPQGGYIKKIAYYPARLPNATLQAMTEA